MTYEELQRQVVNQLRELGIWFEYDERIASFWLCNNLKYVAPSGVDITNVIKDLNALTIMRRDGKEPPHENGKYTNFGRTGANPQGEATKT
jgi:hypothetical protein